VSAPKQIRTASLTSVRASAQLYEQNVFRRLWSKKHSSTKPVKGTGTPTLVNFSRKYSSTLTDSEDHIVDSSSDPDCCPGSLPLATSTPHMSSSSSTLNQLSQAAGSLLGLGVSGITPLPGEAPLPQRSPRGRGATDSRPSSADNSQPPGPSGVQHSHQDSQQMEGTMDSLSAPQPAGSMDTGAILDLTIVSTSSDWPDNVIFDSTRPTGSLPQHLQLLQSDGITLPPIDSLRPTIAARRNSLVADFALKPDLSARQAIKRNLPFGSPAKSAKSEGGSLSDMDSSDGGHKSIQSTIKKKKRKQQAPVSPSVVQSLQDQISSINSENKKNQLHTINALNMAMEEITSLKAQMEKLQLNQGVMVDSIDINSNRMNECEATLQEHGRKIQEVYDSQHEVASQWNTFQEKWNRTQGQAGQAVEPSHSSAFFLGGVSQLRALLSTPPQMDPVEVVATLLRQLSLYCSVDRIYVADNQAASRLEARAVVLYMRSAFHKRDAMIKIKRFLATHQVRDTTVRDCFPPTSMEVARNLNRYGGHLRRTQGYQRFRVIADRDGQPILQMAKQGASYVDYNVTQGEMNTFLANLAPTVTQTTDSGRGKTGPGHRAKNRPILVSARPLLADGQNSSNHVPQGPIRQTTHLVGGVSYGGRAPANRASRATTTPAIPNQTTQRALQQQHIHQQAVYLQQQQPPQPFQQPQQQTSQQLQHMNYQQHQMAPQQAYMQPNSLPFQQQQYMQANVPIVPQPGSGLPATYQEQWPALIPVTSVTHSAPYSSVAAPPSHAADGQHAYGHNQAASQSVANDGQIAGPSYSDTRNGDL
jgi:uncharacterized protein YoxC